jgi:hypothetical protein
MFLPGYYLSNFFVAIVPKLKVVLLKNVMKVKPK